MIAVDTEALDQTGEDAPVEVNQRALIDKVLARYSGEFTLFRELLQNSDDARSSAAEIRFGTTTSPENKIIQANCPQKLSDINSTPVVQWTFRNNGKPFTQDDWRRLPKIAEGNPNPEKIGAFGVGFYSLFSVTDRPFVSSGGYGMQFYWKENTNQLYVRRGDLPSRDPPDPWTTFVMPLREPCPMPPALALMRFLASSITFMVNLEDVALFFDDHRIGHIKKSIGPPRPIEFPVELQRSSPERNIMDVKDVQCRPITIEAEVMHAVYTSTENEDLTSSDVVESLEEKQLGDSMDLDTSNVVLTVFTVEVDVKVDEKLSKDLYRCMKKNPPSKLKYSLIYTGKDEYDESCIKRQNQQAREFPAIFQGLRADLEGSTHTRIFIGHATGQTTGIGGHMASYFIPTVERESIDLVDRNVAIWNRELLYVGGLLCRAVYESELSEIQTLWEQAASGSPNSRPSLEIQAQLHRRFLHVLRFFTFHHSTPSPKVSQLLANSFYGCSSLPLRLLSSVGVREAPDIRAFDPVFARFLKSLPMLSEYVSQRGAHTIAALPNRHKIPSISFQDVLQDLRNHTLNKDELIACLQWWMTQKEEDPITGTAGLLSAASFRGMGETVCQMSSIQYFVDAKALGIYMPSDGPLPDSLIPLDISKHFTRTELASLRWREFTVTSWLEYISRADVMSADPRYDFTQSIDWAACVLVTLSRLWPTLPEEARRMARDLFSKKNCIPTTCGLRSPEGSYLPVANLSLFHDLNLPVVHMPDIESRILVDMQVLLTFIGVRRHAPPELLLDRLVDMGDWSIVDLIIYLVQVQNTLSSSEFSKLKSSAAFTKEEETTGDASNKSRHCAHELYPPQDIFRELGLPVIHWGKKSKWLNDSDEAELLYRLGLRRYPPLETIINLCSSPDPSVRRKAFIYLCENLRSKYQDYDPDNFREVEFVPAENKDGTCLKKLGDVFSGTQWKSLGFSVVEKPYQRILIGEIGVQQHPPSSRLLHLLETSRPSDEETARQWFECLSDCIPSFTQPELTRISELLIVPVNYAGTREWLAPGQCYLGDPMDDFHAKLFVFVNFSPSANRFLSACGSKNEPSVKDVAESLIDNPDRFYKLAGGCEAFLAKLRDLAARSTRIPNGTLNRMSSQPTLLGLRRKQSDDQGGWEHVHELRRPDEIVIIDDFRDYELFSDFIFAAPQEEPLERFYTSIGCRRLSTVIQEKYDESPEILDTKTCTELQTLVLARLPLFLQKCTHTQPKIPVPSSPENFKVRVCRRLFVTKTLTIGNSMTPRTQDVWATTKYDEQRGMELWLSRHAKPDMYEVAASLCRLLFGTTKVSDTLLLGTILSTDLEVLKRTGYNVDQISKRRPQDEASKRSMTKKDSHNQPHRQGSLSQFVSFGLPVSAFSNVRDAYHGVKRRLVSGLVSLDTSENAASLPSSWTSREVISQNYIRKNVDEAINACALGGGKLLDSKDEVIRFLNNRYCNDSSCVGSLQLLDTIDDIKVHVAQGVSLTNTFMRRKRGMLTRFLGIIKPIAWVYNLPLTSLNIFYDVPGGPIAFNDVGNIYLNLRYFEEWHDVDVKEGHTQEAQTSWFFALAHELAHNLISSHDSAHEFWFSAICEAHLLAFSNLLRSQSASPGGIQVVAPRRSSLLSLV